MGQSVRIGAPSTPLGDWRHRAACRDEDPELWFPVGDSGPALRQTEQAKAVCRRCTVRDECLRWALDTGQQHGVWGGKSEQERRRAKVPQNHGTQYAYRVGCRCVACEAGNAEANRKSRDREREKARERRSRAVA